MYARRAILQQWQQAIDDLHSIPSETLAGRTARTKLVAYERDFQNVAGFTANNLRSGSVIQASRLAAETAQKFSNKPVQTVNEWQEAERLWEDAITHLNTIKVEDADYVQAQKLLQQYKSYLTVTKVRLQQERESAQAYDQAQALTQDLFASIPDNAKQLSNAQVGQLRRIVSELKKVKQKTTVYADAQTMLKSAQTRLR